MIWRTSASSIHCIVVVLYTMRVIQRDISPVSTKNTPLTGNWAEGTPEWIKRARGAVYYRALSAAYIQYSYTGKSFSDENDLRQNNPTRCKPGPVPALPHTDEYCIPGASTDFLKYFSCLPV